MKENFETKLHISNLCNQIINLDKEKYDLTSMAFRLKGFNFVEIDVRGLNRDLNTYFNMKLTDVPYFRLVELFNEIQKHSNIKSKGQEILYPLECEISFTVLNLCNGWHVQFVSRDIDEKEENDSVYPEEWIKDIRL